MSYTRNFTVNEYVNLIEKNCCEKAFFERYCRRYLNVNCIIMDTLSDSIKIYSCNCSNIDLKLECLPLLLLLYVSQTSVYSYTL